jgi:hypothetical protein
MMSVSQLIARVGETDQLFLTQPSPELAIERAHLRLAMVQISHSKTEQLHFLGEAAVILELAAVEVTEQAIHERLSAQLAAVYLQFHHLSRESRYLVVAGQILRPHSSAAFPEVYLQLARIDAARRKPALTKHWLTRWLKALTQTPTHMPHFVLEACPEFADILHEAWFVDINRASLALIQHARLNPASPIHS